MNKSMSPGRTLNSQQYGLAAFDHGTAPTLASEQDTGMTNVFPCMGS